MAQRPLTLRVEPLPIALVIITAQQPSLTGLMTLAVPTMAITSSTVSDGATSSDSTIAMIFTSSKATTNFVIGDITVVGGALSSFNAASSTVYTATFTPSGNGAKTIDVAGGAFTDSLATIIQPPLSLTGPMTQQTQPYRPQRRRIMQLGLALMLILFSPSVRWLT